ncbi:MAG: DUF4399 domain-containing protein [Gammaproteobacteria bacterium]|nr:DUF4399 domain-containing protein [Gammaproteobacteria bacterium]
MKKLPIATALSIAAVAAVAQLPLVLADFLHVPHDPAVCSEQISIIVVK